MDESRLDTQELLKTLAIKDDKRLEEIKSRYQGKIIFNIFLLVSLVFFLLVFGIGQFTILEQSFEQRFNIDSNSILFGFKTSSILSSMIVGFLPLSSIIDESGIVGRTMRIRIRENNFSAVWILFILDLLLTFQAILSFKLSNSIKVIQLIAQEPLIAFGIAAVFSIATIYITKGIVSIRKIISYLEDDLSTVIIHKFDPHPSYKDAEQIRLNKEKEAAIEKLKEEKLKYEGELEFKKAQYEQAEFQYQESLESQRKEYEKQIQDGELEYTKKVYNLENKIKAYEEYFNSINELKKNFNQARKPIVDLVSQGKGLFEKVGNLDELVKELKFPNLNVKLDTKAEVEIIEQRIYYYSSSSWQDLPLPSELSPISNTILSIIEPELPEPKIEYYAPREGLAECLVLNFADYNAIVYFRDETYKKEGKEWTEEDNSNFKKMFNQKRIDGLYPLEFTAQEIIENPQSVLKQIKDVINSKTDNT